MSTKFRGVIRLQTIVWTLVLTTLVTGWLPVESQAMLAPPDESLVSESVSSPNRADDLRTVRSVIENKLVHQRLEDLGFTQEEINTRLNQLSDAQLHQVAMQINALLPGGQDVIWTIVGILLIVLLIILLAILL
jgi:hypothetical protein